MTLYSLKFSLHWLYESHNTFEEYTAKTVLIFSEMSKNVLYDYIEQSPSSAFYVTRRFITVFIALGYGLDNGGSRVRFPAGAKNFSLHHLFQNGSGAHPVYYPMGTGGSFPRDKAAGA